MKKLLALAGVSLLWLSVASHALETDHFKAFSTKDLVRLCSVTPEVEHALEAISFCHGFGVGAWRYHQAMLPDPNADFICMPNPEPTRSVVLREFAEWAKSNPQFMDEPAVDSLFRFLEIKFPCRG